MPNIKTGRDIQCVSCGAMFYRAANYLKRGLVRMTCGKPECRSSAVSGENNPFWGKIHDEGTRQRIREGKRARPAKKRKQRGSPEHRAMMAEHTRRRWVENRDAMLAAVEHLKSNAPRDLQRYRRNFTPMQRREWKAANCLWCKSNGRLILDHIIPVMCGGTNVRRNAQTLCQPCNMWKMVHVDRQLFLAGLGE